MDYPAVFKMPIAEMAEGCGWRVKKQGAATLICPEEQYGRRLNPGLLRTASVIDGGTIGRDDLFRPLDGWRLGDARIDPTQHPEGWASINGRLHSGSLPGILQGASLAFVAVPDSEFPAFVQTQLTPLIAAAVPDFRLCLVDVHDRVTARLAAIRGLFAGRHAPDTLVSGPDFRSFAAIHTSAGSHLHNLLFAPALAATAPYALGLAMSRLAGVAVWLYGRPVDFVAGAPVGTLADLFVVSAGLGSLAPPPSPSPAVGAAESLAFMRWWVTAADRLLSVALDVTNFIGPDGTYQPHQHLGLLISLERFLAATQTSLNYARRDGFTRMLMLFETLDILQGLGLGDYERTLSIGRLEGYSEALGDSLPTETAAVVLPRCREAITALRMVGEGFRASRRTPDGLVTARDKNGRDCEVSLDRAVVAVLRAARNGGHGLGEILDDPRDLSFLEAHDGEIQASVADAGFLHLIRLLDDPELLVRSLRRRLTMGRGVKASV